MPIRLLPQQILPDTPNFFSELSSVSLRVLLGNPQSLLMKLGDR
jgi:hypothetical protein